jgi:hypothetical protein
MKKWCDKTIEQKVESTRKTLKWIILYLIAQYCLNLISTLGLLKL